MSPPPTKGRFSGEWTSRGDHRRDSSANDRLVCSPYYPPHDIRAARIKGRCVDNAVGLDGQRQCARQPEVQSKVDVLGGPPATAAEAAVQAEYWLNLARSRKTDQETGYENRLPALATSDPLIPINS